MNMPLQMGNSHGRPALFQGKSPGVSGSAGRGAFPFGPMNPRPVNQTMGWSTNYTINYAFVCRRFKSKSDEALRAGQVVFVRRQSHYVLGDARLATLCNVVQLNYLLRKLSKLGKDLEYSTNSPEHLRTVVAEWCPLGIVCNEIGGAREDQPQERLLNVCIRGRTSVTNIWGQGAIRDGTRLWVVLYWQKETTATDESAKRFRVRLNEAHDPEDVTLGQHHNAGCWQVGMWAHKVKTHPSAPCDSEKIGDIGKTCFEECFDLEANTPTWPMPFGRVSSKGYLHSFGSSSHTKEAHKDVDRYTTLPQFEIFVDPGLHFPAVVATPTSVSATSKV
jgi:hypothetical protein